jgi:hypothetical protein
MGIKVFCKSGILRKIIGVLPAAYERENQEYKDEPAFHRVYSLKGSDF